MTAKLDGTNGLLQQYDYQTPTTGFSYTFASGTTVLVIDPAGTLATGTITMPAAPADGMTISFSSDQTITALTVNANAGQSIVGNPTTLLAGGAATFVYRLSNTTWYAQASTAAIGNTGAGAPIVTIYTSPSPWTKPATLKAVKVTVVAGGGGGGSNPASQSTGGGSGAVGFYFDQAPSIPGPLTVTVGAAGAGVAGTAGTSGGTSSFGPLISATGGAGGPTAPGGVGGAGGTITTSPKIYGIPGSAGGSGNGATSQPNTQFNLQTFQAGNAGSTAFGFGYGGANNQSTYTTGFAGTGYGSGGGGSRTAGAGAAGKAGIIIVEEFY